jgi:hypothetical protein
MMCDGNEKKCNGGQRSTTIIAHKLRKLMKLRIGLVANFLNQSTNLSFMEIHVTKYLNCNNASHGTIDAVVFTQNSDNGFLFVFQNC